MNFHTLILTSFLSIVYSVRSLQEPVERKLQLPPVVAQEIGIIATAIPALIAELETYETTITIRFTTHFSAIWWNCVATYSDDYKDALTKQRPTVVVTETLLHNTANRAACVAQATATYVALSLPGALAGYATAMSGIGITVEDALDATVKACGPDILCLQSLASGQGFNPVLMGHIIAKQAYDFSLADGWNQLGKDDGCQVNCRAYEDTTGYVPVNLPYGKSNGFRSERWQPMLEDDGKGYFSYQEHVTPHIGKKALFRYLPESDRITRVASNPPYSKSRFQEANAVIARMAQLNDQKKIEVELFDNKLIVVDALIDAFVGKVLTDGYVDMELGQPGLVLSFERFVHFIQTVDASDYDAIVIAWKEKVKFDLIRPTTVIQARGMTNITTWAAGGNGVQTFRAKDFEAYKRVMPHSEYVSGSACFFQAQKDFIHGYLTAIGLDSSSFPITFPVVQAGGSNVEPGVVPAQPIQLTYPDIDTMAHVGGISRLDGGMHFPASVSAAEALCSGVADHAVVGSIALYQ